MTVVAVEGSAYRRPGVKMLVPADDESIGSVTAGCLEDEVVRLANEVIEAGQPRVETFDLTGEDDVWGLGVGCNGVIDLLLEPIDGSYKPVLDAYEADEPISNITILDSGASNVDAWQRAYHRPTEDFAFDSEQFPRWLIDALEGPAITFTDEGTAGTVELNGPDGDITVFVDGITPPPTFVAIGTNHDVRPIVEFANRNDFRTVVVGFRGATATDARFPAADEVVSTSPMDIWDAVDFDEDTYVVVMSHSFVDDRLALDELVQTPVPYVGLMGPQKRFKEMLETFDSEGRSFTEAELSKVYTPVGLDLGGGTPYQIAHSIVAEVLAVHNERDPRHLKDREEPIHNRVVDPMS